jgi:signal transduction histidine kinase
MARAMSDPRGVDEPKSLPERSSHPSAAERFAERVERFSAELRERTEALRTFEQDGAEDDIASLRGALQELRNQHTELIAADEELHRQLEELQRTVRRADRERARQEQLLGAVSDVVLVLSRSGVVEEANDAARRVFAMDARWLTGTPIVALLDGSDHRSFYTALEEASTSRTVRVSISIRRRDRLVVPLTATCSVIDGGRRVLLTAQRIILHDDGETTEVSVERAGLERELRDKDDLLAYERAARHRLEERVRATDRFLAVLSHDLRAPINVVLGWTDLLTREHLAKDARDRALATIARNARLQLGLVEQLLDLSRVSAGNVFLNAVALDVAALIPRVCESFLPASRDAGVTLTFDVTTTEPAVVFADVMRVEQVLSNLVSNAIKFSSAGGKVKVALASDGHQVAIRVSDDGRGIAPSHLLTIFERFGQTDPADARLGGLGLGLYIAHQLVTLQGGSLHAESDGLGHGATFVVRLPTRQGAPAPAERPSTKEPLARLDGLRVLVVEDDTDERELLVTMLNDGGATASATRDAFGAMAVYSTFRPDVVVSDIGLPWDDGLSLIRRIRVIDPEVLAVALSSFARKEEAARALEAGFDVHLSKPLSAKALMGAIAESTGKRR